MGEKEVLKEIEDAKDVLRNYEVRKHPGVDEEFRDHRMRWLRGYIDGLRKALYLLEGKVSK